MQKNGIKLDHSQMFSVDEPSGTGFTWLYQVSPASCFNASKDVTASDGLIGGSKTATIHLNLNGVYSQNCTMGLVLARPWLFSGFNEDGTINDPSTVI